MAAKCRSTRFALVGLLGLMLGAGPASQPAADSYPALQKKLAELTAMVDRLAAELTSLKAENVSLLEKIKSLTPVANARKTPVKPSSTFESRTKQMLDAAPAMGMKVDKKAAQADIENAKHIDELITGEAARDVDPEIVAAMFEGRVAVGMNEAQVKIVTDPQSWQNMTEFKGGKTFLCWTWGPSVMTQGQLTYWDITIRNDSVVVVHRRD